MPLSPGHLDWMVYITDKASDAGIRLDICLLEYGTSLCNSMSELSTYRLVKFGPAQPIP